jgi:diaminopimelate decarboxylase
MRDATFSAEKPEDPGFVAGRLHWHGCDLGQIADRFGTPCHVAAAEAAAAALRRFLSPFERAGLPVAVRFSVKSNPVPVYLEALRRLDVGFEVGSLHELDLATRLGIRGDRIAVSGLRDGTALALAAAAAGAEIVTAATRGQLDALLAAAPLVAGDRRLPVAISVSPGLARARWDTTLSSGSPSSPLGFPALSAEMDEAMDALAREPRFSLEGLHMHIGSGVRQAAPFVRALAVAERVVRNAAARGHRLTTVDAGGGFGLASAPVRRALAVVASLLRSGERPPSTPAASSLLPDVASAAAACFARLERDGLRPEALVLEPGRLLSGPSQLLLLTVTDVVDRGSRGRFLLCDGGAMAISPLFVLESHRVEALLDTAGPRRVYRVLGNLPTAMDRVAPAALLPEQRPGDRIAVLDTGAYAVSMNNTFNGPRPPVVWIVDGVARLARRREAPDEVHGRDLLPAGFGVAKESER